MLWIDYLFVRGVGVLARPCKYISQLGCVFDGNIYGRNEKRQGNGWRFFKTKNETFKIKTAAIQKRGKYFQPQI